ncbi:hypothetical protein EOW65_02905 [Sinirhodobacter ferrireducens]|uniref:Translation initiation factor 2 n=1 Tax=Paenirhodobacter ferrireducens TaxID=1215032 RepID=A0A443LRK7_9RHOB|nr:hypothetical protein [Sinirhodobacter ferrireducens]RWR51823.1 hypothetical protein EOW65_02905 [Sinirhodobacter ferrireducens]
MKPSFALNLSHDGIGLLLRTPTGWEVLGEVSLDAPNLSEELGRLRRLAEARAPETGVLTKLIIPASQILYAEIAAPGPRPAMRRRQITAALEGMTPYKVPDLVFDWSGRGETVQVAIVARDTLAEAESFAEDWGFCPVGFVAVPAPGRFAGEPWFGLSSVAGRHLPDGTRLDRDQDPVPLASAPHAAADEPVLESVERVEEPAPEPHEAPEADLDAIAPAEELAAPEIVTATEDPAAGDTLVPDEAAPEAEAQPAPEAPEVAAAPPAEASADETEAEPAEIPADAQPQLPADAEELPATEPAAVPEPATETALLATSDDDTGSEIDAPEAAPDLDRAPDGPLEPEAAPATETTADDSPAEPITPASPIEAPAEHPVEADAALAPLDAMPEAETSELAAAEGPSESDTLAVAAALAAAEVSAIEETAEAAEKMAEAEEDTAEEHAAEDDSAEATAEVETDVAEEDTAEAVPEAETDEDVPEAENPPEPATDGAAEAGTGTAARTTRIPPLAGVARASAPPRPLGGAVRPAAITAPGLELTEDEAAPVLAAPRKPRPAEPKPAPGAHTAVPPETTVFGARRQKQIGGKPRHLGIALMLALVIFLGLVAIWASYLDTPAPVANSVAAPEQDSAAQGLSLGTDSAALTGGPADAASDLATASSPDSPGPADAAASDIPADADLAGIDAEMAADGVIPEATPTGSAEGLAAAPDGTLSSPQLPAEPAADGQDPAPAAPVADALAAAAEATAAGAPAGAILAPAAPQPDLQPAVPAAPPPFEELARVSPGASFEPTPEGVVTPGGFTLYSGRPPRASRARPDAVTKAAIAAEEAAALPWADPALKRFKPKTRPATVETAAAVAATAPAPQPAPAATEPPKATEAETETAAAPVAPLSAEAQRLAAQRPSTRPSAVERSAEAAAAAAEAEAAKAEAEAQAAKAEAEAGATAQAVSVSRRPAARPRSFKTSVEQALALAIAAEPEPVIAAAAPAPVIAAPAPASQKAAPAAPQRGVAAAPEPAVELDEPEPTLPTKRMPTSASVAKQATEQNALALREMNLIGVYGASGNRRALIRMPNGRFVKVAVGDRLDGGRVTAIGDGQLSYQKGSRTLMLKMLKGS